MLHGANMNKKKYCYTKINYVYIFFCDNRLIIEGHMICYTDKISVKNSDKSEKSDKSGKSDISEKSDKSEYM